MFKKNYCSFLPLLLCCSLAAHAELDDDELDLDIEKIFAVTSAEKDKLHPNFNLGSKFGFSIDGVPGQSVVLTQGKTYMFQVDSGVKHDFYLSNSPVGWGEETFTEGVKGNFTYKGIVTLATSLKSPKHIYYQCRNHKYMGGDIYIVKAGEKFSPPIKKPVAKAPVKVRKVTKKFSDNDVMQKIRFADMYINKSKVASKVRASKDEAAKEIMAMAKDSFQRSQQAYDKKDLSTALSLVDTALMFVSNATLRVKISSQEAELSQYAQLITEVTTFVASYLRHGKRLGESAEGKKSMEEVNEFLLLAEDDGANGRYAEANVSLKKAQRLITRALGNMLNKQTVVYDKNFETPEDEYLYEFARYQSYEELVPLALEQKKPTKRAVALIEKFVDRSKEVRAEAIKLAAKKDFKQAIMAITAATTHVQRALRVAGVGL